ncbi:unnamed protein product [Brachionus calyciflorus]|uniref:U6 snRNA-associated Sm-like protein LSm8 n=1 Tax=Brachionus calyciflorus TaxID=104777 RepID=A0A813RJX2_9BILA|nr:unnamed protein product [Brachionus calyciflorus]
MSTVLEPLVNHTINVITSDGRVILGVLRGFDQTINLILDDSYERVFTMNGVEQVKLGVFIIRGDNVAIVGEVDEDLDRQIDLTHIRADPLLPITH